MRFTTASAAALLAGSANAFWRMECRGQSGLARLDPLVDPGKVSPHAHTIFGSSGFSATSGSDQLIAGDCTSCAVTEDKSAYWTPTLHFKDAATGQFTIVPQVGGMLAYYFLNPQPGDSKITAFPHGFEMIAGDTNQRNFSDTAGSTQFGLSQKALGFNCLNYDIAPEGSLYRHFLPDKGYMDANCKDGIRAELMFPSCWNNKDVTSPNKKDHVAYPSTVMDGVCPDDFPVRLPGLFFETIWNTAAFTGKDGEFVFSNGDPTGYGYHGDFIMGWDEDFLQSAVDTCTNPSGRIQDCPLFTIQPEATADTCKIGKSILGGILAVDNISGPSASLPGGVPISPGPEYVVKGAPPPPDAGSGAPVPTLSHSAGSTIKASETIIPGGVFAEGKNSAPKDAVAAVEPSITPAPTVALADNQKPYTTSYKTEGGSVIEIIVIEEVTTVTDQPEIKTVTMHKRHAHRHGRRG